MSTAFIAFAIAVACLALGALAAYGLWRLAQPIRLEFHLPDCGSAALSGLLVTTDQEISMTTRVRKAAASAAVPAASTPRETKLDASLQPLPPDAAEWAAVRIDNGAVRFEMLKGNVGNRRFTQPDALKACAELTALGLQDWRAPTLEEEEAIRDLSRFNPAVNPQFFPDIEPDAYWTASPDASVPQVFAWVVDLYYGSALIARRDGHAYVRAVRSVSSPSSPRQ